MVKLGRIKLENERFQDYLGVATKRNKIRETHLRLFWHVQCRPTTAPVKKSLDMKVDGPPRGRNRPKKIWMEVVKIDMKKCSLSEDLAQDRSEWRNRIRVADLNIVGTRL